MSLSDITNKIQSDAEASVKKIEAEAARVCEGIEKEARERMVVLQKEHEKRIEEKLSQNELRIKESAKRAGRTAAEMEKRALVNRVFEKAYGELCALESSEYQKVLSELIKDLPQALDGAVAFVSPKRIAETKKVLSAKNVHIDIKEDKDVEGGLRIEGRDFEYDLSFKTLFEQRRDNLEVEVANTLFA